MFKITNLIYFQMFKITYLLYFRYNKINVQKCLITGICYTGSYASVNNYAVENIENTCKKVHMFQEICKIMFWLLYFVDTNAEN